MKAKTIKSVLRNKVNAWLASIEDEEVRKLAKENTIVTGGAIASMLLGEPINDLDIYMRTRKAAVHLANYYCKKFEKRNDFRFEGIFPVEMNYDEIVNDPDIQLGNTRVWVDEELPQHPDRFGIVLKTGQVKIFLRSSGVAGDYDAVADDPAEAEAQDRNETTEPESSKDEEATGQPKPKTYDPVFMTSNCISLQGKIQIVCRFFGEPDEIHENYDFVHCTNYWQSWDGHLELRPKALEALLNRELVYVGSKYPVCSMFRVRKFLNRGFKINAGQLVKMAWQIHELDLADVDVLEDQLIGVDHAYFVDLIYQLRDKKFERVEGNYLFGLIDKIF